jgi:proteic killer suppression protein
LITSFADRETKLIFEGTRSRKLPNQIQDNARRKLRYLHQARVLSDLLAPPGNHLEKLEREHKGQYSIRINKQWRICFHWIEGHATEVEITDYH